MENIQKIKERLKDSPELLETLENLIDAPRQRDEIYMYCFKRQTTDNKTHYIPLITFLDNQKSLMVCNDVKTLQEDYEQEIARYKLYGLPLIIIEVPFDTYVRLSIQIERVLNAKPSRNFTKGIKQLKACALFENITMDEDILRFLSKDLAVENNYCKCLDENLNIVECGNYKPLTSSIGQNSY